MTAIRGATFDEITSWPSNSGASSADRLGSTRDEAPAYFRSIALPIEDRSVQALGRHGWNNAAAPVFIQSFEKNLRDLRPKTAVRLIQLLEDQIPTDAELHEIKTYADGIGPNSRMVIPAQADRTLMAPSDLVERAHRAGLLVHIWTLRIEPVFLSPSYNGDPDAEFRQFQTLGVDGIFTDFPDVAFRALRAPGPPR